MRCTRIEFKGYKRLADTATNIDGGITAFVGLNEAGKTTLLEALTWLSGGDALEVTDKNRTRPPSSDGAVVVKAFYALDEADKEAIRDLPMHDTPTSMSLGRRADGTHVYWLHPRPSRSPKPFADAAARLRSSRKRLAKQFADASDEDDDDPTDWAETVSTALDRPDDEWKDGQVTALKELSAWLSEVPATGRTTKPRDERLSKLLDNIKNVVIEDHPAALVGRRLLKRVPKFVLFEDENRALETTHELSNEQTRKPPPALRDLLMIADISIDKLWEHISNGDVSSRETLLDRGNERLLTFFSQAWNQSNVTVRLNVTGTRHEVLVKELRDKGGVTNISERSDGLRTFVALAAFLASGGWTTPPILLIDEAETHLHYNAQADLVGVLLKSVNATQVFYTTHSPGCLPSDLGSGIRLVSRDPAYGDASLIKNNFWQDQEPGFAPLLYAMGAGAAAFSMCRKAVLAEGPSDMILLPSLMRMATNKDDLEYQVAPGLANSHSYGMRVEEVAAKVVYLTDGDKAGEQHKEQLTEAGVDAARIFHLPKPMAVEDLINRDVYVATLNELLEDMGQPKRVTKPDLSTGKTAAKALTEWGKQQNVTIPSKVEIAYALLRNEDLRLTAEGRRALVKLHGQFNAALSK